MKQFQKDFSDGLYLRVEDDGRDNYNSMSAELVLPIEKYEYSDDAVDAVMNVKLHLNAQINNLIAMRDYLESPAFYADMRANGLHE